MKNKGFKIIGMLLLLVAMTGCSLLKKSTETKRDSNSSKGIELFLADFEKAAVTHNTDKLIELMDQDYVKEQLVDFLNGNTTQFLDEFFCGDKVDGSGFACLQYMEITSLNKVELNKENDGYRVSYDVYSNQTGVKTSWTITLKNIHGKLIYGLVGAVG
jgi:hypothetical protein